MVSREIGIFAMLIELHSNEKYVRGLASASVLFLLGKCEQLMHLSCVVQEYYEFETLSFRK